MKTGRRILIHGGMVFDGSGAAGKCADVLIAGERIEAVGCLDNVGDAVCIDATGKAVAPGFIDPHNHADNEVEGGILRYPKADNLVRQGITTLICNQCGGGTYPVGPFLDAFDAAGAVTNVGMLAAHGPVRSQALRESGQSESCPAMWAVMRVLLTREMESGAFGVTTGILGAPFTRVPTEELIEAGRAVAAFDGVYASHIRDEGEYGRHLEAISEVGTVARESGARGHVSHLKLWGHPNWGQTENVRKIFDRAEAEGTVLKADQYPYIGGYRGFFSLLWDKQNPSEINDAWRRAAETEVARQLDLLGGPGRLYISSHEPGDPVDGMTIQEAGDALGLRPERVVTELYTRSPRPRLSAFFLAMREEDVREFMTWDVTMAGTDSHVRVPNSGASHPRNFGVYPRLLGKYVREEKIMPMETMIHRMTQRVADQFGIRGRGLLVPGQYADVVVFDPVTVRDTSTWRDGYAYPVGIETVLVNGGITVANGVPTGGGFGRALRRGS